MILILILVAIALATIAGVALLKLGGDGFDGRHFLAFSLGVVLLAGTGFSSVCYAFTVYSWVAADTKASILNREYGTHYTGKEVFFASDVIDTVRELDRKRVEVNGDVFRDQPDRR